MAYKWAHPGEWLAEKIAEADETTLRGYLNSLLPSLDSDTIQDTFQDEMGADGYFNDDDAVGDE